MTPAEIATAAVRNRQSRLSQLSRLHSLRVESRAQIEALRARREGAKEQTKQIETISSLKWVPNFFPTPPKVMSVLLEWAAIEPGTKVLEPSAGAGHIVKAVRAFEPTCRIDAYEIVPKLAEMVRTLGVNCLCADFLEIAPDPVYDRVVMNPPFERGVDQDHVRHARRFLRPGGRLAAVVCAPTARKLEDIGWFEDLPAGSFATGVRPTGVHTSIVIVEN